MTSLMNVEEAMRYFGIKSRRKLERIVDRYDIDADFDEDGDLLSINADEAREALFEEHREAVGYRPDDREQMAKARRKEQEREQVGRQQRYARRKKFKQRMSHEI